MAIRPTPPGFDPAVWSTLEEARALIQAGDAVQALGLYERLWTELSRRGDHFHAMVVAHTAGAAEPDPEKKHTWNVAALGQADVIPDVVRSRGMYASLYNNLGLSHSMRGEADDARRCFELALEHLGEVQPQGQAGQMRAAIERNIARLPAVPGA